MAVHDRAPNNVRSMPAERWSSNEQLLASQKQLFYKEQNIPTQTRQQKRRRREHANGREIQRLCVVLVCRSCLVLIL